MLYWRVGDDLEGGPRPGKVKQREKVRGYTVGHLIISQESSRGSYLFSLLSPKVRLYTLFLSAYIGVCIFVLVTSSNCVFFFLFHPALARGVL